MKSKVYSVLLTVFLLMLTVAISFTATFGRYRQKQSDKMFFEPQSWEQIYLWDAQQVGGKLQNVTGWTVLDDHTAQLDFLVANGKSQTEFAKNNMRAALSLAISQSICTEDGVEVVLTVGETVYAGIITPITEGTTDYVDFGPGFMVRFADEHGREITVPLQGGKLSSAQCRLTVKGTEKSSQFDSLLRLTVRGLAD